MCTVAASGNGLGITAAKAAKIDLFTPGPHPPCTRAALTTAPDRAFHKRSLAPSYLTRGLRCAGNYAWGDYIKVN